MESFVTEGDGLCLEQMVGDVCECEERGNMGVIRFVKKFKGVITVVVFLTEVEVYSIDRGNIVWLFALFFFFWKKMPFSCKFLGCIMVQILQYDSNRFVVSFGKSWSKFG